MRKRPYLTTAQVAKALGIGVSTVKHWIDRGILPAAKTVGGHRRLQLADVQRLVRERHLPHADLSSLMSAAHTDEIDTTELSKNVYDCVTSGDLEMTRNTIMGSYERGMRIDTLADQVIAPVMMRIGNRWESGQVNLAHEHRATEILASVLYSLKDSLRQSSVKTRPLAVGAAPAGDWYFLPNLLAEMVLLDLGWETVNLGANTPLSSLADAVSETMPRLVWLSVSDFQDEISFVRDYLRFYDRIGTLDVAIAIGGRALTADLRAKLRYTTFGDGLRQLAEFARTLNPLPRPPKRGRPPKGSGQAHRNGKE